MKFNKISKIYATALVEVSSNLSEMEVEFGNVHDFFKNGVEFWEFFNSPKIQQNIKIQILEKTFQGRISVNLLSFLSLLILRSRFMLLFEIFDFFKELADIRLDRIRVKVLSFPKLKDHQIEMIKDSIGSQLHKQVLIETRESSKILGGFILKMNDSSIDSSMRSQLEHLRGLMEDSKMKMGEEVYEN